MELFQRSKMSLTKKGRITVPAFVRYLVHLSETNSAIDPLWGSYHHLCDPCGVNYDYILKTNTLNEDIHKLHPHNTQDFVSNLRLQMNDSLDEARKMFGEVPAIYYQKLLNYFIEDFIAFGYNSSVIVR